MIFKEYVDKLNTLLRERPETADFMVVTSIDDEGNGYDIVYNAPAVGSYDGEDREFTEEREVNSVCVS